MPAVRYGLWAENSHSCRGRAPALTPRELTLPQTPGQTLRQPNHADRRSKIAPPNDGQTVVGCGVSGAGIRELPFVDLASTLWREIAAAWSNCGRRLVCQSLECDGGVGEEGRSRESF